MDGFGTPGSWDPVTGRTTGGVIVAWDPGELQVDRESMRTIQEGRIVALHARVLRDAHGFEVIGAYMPCRSSSADAAVDESWDLLEDAVGMSGDVLIGGDLNARANATSPIGRSAKI